MNSLVLTEPSRPLRSAFDPDPEVPAKARRRRFTANMGVTSRSTHRAMCRTVVRRWRRWTSGVRSQRRRRRRRAGRLRCFAAALDAASGKSWLHEPVLGDPVAPRYATQRRWLERVGRILGLSAAVEGRQAEQIAEELDLMGLEHWPARQRFVAARSLRERGTAVASVLSQLALDAAVWLRLLTAGYLGGAWARPWVWSPPVGRRLSPFSRVGRAVRGPPSISISANEIRSSVG